MVVQGICICYPGGPGNRFNMERDIFSINFTGNIGYYIDLNAG